jgi:hypothetical protein
MLLPACLRIRCNAAAREDGAVIPVCRPMAQFGPRVRICRPPRGGGFSGLGPDAIGSLAEQPSDGTPKLACLDDLRCPGKVLYPLPGSMSLVLCASLAGAGILLKRGAGA